LIGELLPSLLRLLEPSHDIEERGSTPEILLLQAQLLAALQAVVGVENRRDGLGTLLVRHGLLILSGVELGEVELTVRRLARPQSQVVGCSCTIARDRSIVCNGGYDLTILPNTDLLAAVILVFPDVAVELDVNRDVVAREFPVRYESQNTCIPIKVLAASPGVEVEPVVRNLHLISIHNLLTENTVAVPESVTPCRIVQCGERVEEAGGKATKTTITQSSVTFLLNDVFHAESKIGQTVFRESVVVLEALVQDSIVPLATSFMPTLSMALSRARPMRNSRERSIGR
jgi:hypothetical protein